MMQWKIVADSTGASLSDIGIHNGEICASSYSGELRRFTGSAWEIIANQLNSYSIASMESFVGKIYSGTYQPLGGYLLEYDDIDSWSVVANAPISTWVVSDLIEYNNILHGGFIITSTIGRLYGWNGSAWVLEGSTINGGIECMIKYKGDLYVATQRESGSAGELWRWNDIDTLTKVAPQLNGQLKINSMEIYNDELVASTYPGGRLFKWNDSNAWLQIADSYYSDNHYVTSIKNWKGDLYGVIGGYVPHANLGALLKFTGSAWEKVADSIISNSVWGTLEVLNERLYCGTGWGHLLEYSEFSPINTIFYGINF